MGKNFNTLIRAAGGLVWRNHEGQVEILLIHRNRYDDWTLPKGKLKANERWEEAALREVAEETGLRTRLDAFANVLYYTVRNEPKVVLFWNMEVIGDAGEELKPDSSDEVSDVAWLPIAQALERMNYRDERDMLEAEAIRRG